MKRKTKIIISITSIIIISLMLLGLTYGYFITRIKGNTNSQSVEISTGTATIKFTDLSEEIETVIEPDYINVKPFTIENTGNVPAKYSIYLVDVINNFSRTEDIIYTLYRIDGIVETTIDNNTDFSEWDSVSTGTFPTVSSPILVDEVIPIADKQSTTNKIYTYALKITYINQSTINQSEDQGKIFSGKINIYPTSNNVFNITEEDVIIAAQDYLTDLLNKKNGVYMNSYQTFEEYYNDLMRSCVSYNDCSESANSSLGTELSTLVKNGYIEKTKCNFVYNKDESQTDGSFVADGKTLPQACVEGNEKCSANCDVNEDGIINTTDIRIAKSYIGTEVDVDNPFSVNSDITCDGVIHSDFTVISYAAVEPEILLGLECKLEDEAECDILMETEYPEYIDLTKFNVKAQLSNKYSLVCE